MNHYAKVIELIAVEQNWKDIVIQIAKKHPKIVADAVYSVSTDWKTQAAAFMADGEKVKAIKLCRSMTGMALLEARDAVESLG